MTSFQEGFLWGMATMIAIRIVRRQWRRMQLTDKLLVLATAVLAGLILSGCAVTPIAFRRVETYQFQTDKGVLTVNVAGSHRVNAELAKHKGEEIVENEVYGFYVKDCKQTECTHTIWTTAYPSTIMHELRHFFEGKFHD